MNFLRKLQAKYQDTKFLTLAEVEELCPSCADMMRDSGMTVLTPSLLTAKTKIQDKAWSHLPKGWTMDSVKSMWKKLGGKGKHKRKACMEKMKGKVSNEGAFCNSLYQLFEAK